jgi:hypothetical protein
VARNLDDEIAGVSLEAGEKKEEATTTTTKEKKVRVGFEEETAAKEGKENARVGVA